MYLFHDESEMGRPVAETATLQLFGLVRVSELARVELHFFLFFILRSNSKAFLCMHFKSLLTH